VTLVKKMFLRKLVEEEEKVEGVVDLKRIHDEVVFHYKELMETIDQRDR
jgi:hypothetical protein